MSERDGAGGRRYGGRTAEERRQARREALLDAAYDLFGTEGYRNVTIERVCSQARLTARNFYEEFGGREALLLAIYDRTIGRSVEAVAAALAKAGDGVRERAAAGLGAYAHTMLEDPRASRIVYVEIVGVSDAAERHRRSVHHAFADLVVGEAQGLLAAGAVTPRRSSRHASLALVGGVNELMIDWVQSDDPLPIDVLVEELVDLFVAVGAGPPDRREI